MHIIRHQHCSISFFISSATDKSARMRGWRKKTQLLNSLGRKHISTHCWTSSYASAIDQHCFLPHKGKSGWNQSRCTPCDAPTKITVLTFSRNSRMYLNIWAKCIPAILSVKPNLTDRQPTFHSRLLSSGSSRRASSTELSKPWVTNQVFHHCLDGRRL